MKTTPLQTVKISAPGNAFNGSVWKVGAFTGWTVEKIRAHLRLPESATFSETDEKTVPPAIATGFYGF